LSSPSTDSGTERELRSTWVREGPSRSLVFESMSLNSTADLAAKDADARVLGNPTEGALLLWLEAHGGDYPAIRSTATVLGRLPFSTEHKFMASLLEIGPSRRVLHVKGAPEVLLSRCSRILTESGLEPFDKWRAPLDEKLHRFQDRGMRTLGFAFKERDVGPAAGELKDQARDLIWLGFVAIQDPVRPEVPAAIETCRRAGIAVKIVTGDNSHTAREIARQAGLWTDNEPPGAQLTGPDFAALPNERVTQAAENLKIMSRARPNDKLRLVKVLKAAGHVVAVTGDGTNDAPALNHADVGLAMGKSGSAAAKEASDIVLLDDSFTSIVNAVKWGRSLYDNIQRFIVFQLTINVAALGLMILGPFAGVKLPLTVTQMLWINLIMDTMGALALASEPPHDSVLDRPPRARDAFIISGAMARNILSMSLIFLAALLALLLFFKRDGVLSRHESTIAFTVLVLMQFWNLFNARAFGRSVSALRGVFKNRGLILIAAAIVIGQFLIVQFGGAVFRTEPLSWQEWLEIFAGTSLVLWAGEIWRCTKKIQNSKFKIQN
ncbi:MAG TPA: cation-translocating P-type ATPase, partial [Planctomycetota bacterium]|nr:cation-translocating P-type ATPase [Planctomycetota bacterium]